MPKHLTRKLGQADLRVRMWTLKDKDSLFRAKEPDRHIVELIASTGSKTIVVMEKAYEDKALARSHYDNFIQAFG